MSYLKPEIFFQVHAVAGRIFVKEGHFLLAIS
jgi:hypothetical protein